MDEHRRLYCIVFGPKRHAQFTMGADGPELVEHAEVALGGFFADPPSLRGRDGHGPHRRWSSAAVLREVRLAVTRAMGADAVRPTAPWDVEGELAFPALRRLEVKTPEMASALPPALRARPGTRYVEAIASRLRGGEHTPVAIDPGGDLSDWQALRWVSKRSGDRIAVTTDPCDVDAVLVESLDDRASRYGRPPRTTAIDEVHVSPHLVRHVGRASGVIDAQLDGLDDLAARRHVLEEVELGGFIRAEISSLGPSAFSRRYGVSLRTVEGIAAGRTPSTRTISKVHRTLVAPTQPARTCALPGCDEVVTRVNAIWCSRRHRDQARAAEVATTPGVFCPRCGIELLGLAAERRTCRPCAVAGP
jgi:hypothetical protein